ncbi:MAG: hypothetical protein AAF211_27835, partial [Myxococcota bacterium]
MTELDRLRDTMQREAWPEALELGLSAWRSLRHACLVDVVLHASEQSLLGFAGPKARTREQFDRSWREVAGHDASAVATGWLAVHLTTKVPEHEPPDGDFQRRGFARERHAALLRRVALLSARGPDPRAARAALAIVGPGRLGAWDEPQTRDLYAPLLDMLAMAGDTSVLPDLQRLVHRPRSRRAIVRSVLATDLPPVLERLAELPAGENRPLQGLRGLVPGQGRSARSKGPGVAELIGLVHDRPDDDDLRAVLGDALLEGGGPRAELVRLEREGVPSDDHRTKSVIRRNAAELMGEALAAVLVRPIFRDGLLHTATVRATQAASIDAWKAAVQAPELGTLRVLRKGHASGVRYSSLVHSPMARDLRRVDVDGPRMLESLADTTARRICGVRFTCVDWDACLHLLSVPALAGVRAIDVPYLHPPFLDEFDRHGLCDRVEELGIASGNAYLGYRGAPVVGALERLTQRFRRLKRFVVAYEGDHRMVAFERDGEGWSLELRLPKNQDRYYFVDHGALFWIDPERPALWQPPRWLKQIRLSGYVPAEIREGLARR